MNDIYGSEVLSIRPFHAMCLVCSLGGPDDLPCEKRVRQIRDAIAKNPDQPIALRCNAGGIFAYQDPGTKEDTGEGPAFNVKRDVEILLRMDLAPGSVLPARVLFKRLVTAIRSPKGICAFDAASSGEWRGCPRAGRGVYERALEKGLDTIIPPRAQPAMESDKIQSLKDMYAAGAIRIRPHILACAVAQYGNGIRPPFKEDNLPELLQFVLEHPDTPLTLVPGADWMMCGPCPSRISCANDCSGGPQATQGLYNTVKDVNVLLAAGWSYGLTRPAREIFRQLLERIPDIDGVCALDRSIGNLSVWRDGCGREQSPCPGYRRGRDLLVNSFPPLSAGLG